MEKSIRELNFCVQLKEDKIPFESLDLTLKTTKFTEICKAEDSLSTPMNIMFYQEHKYSY